MPLSSCSPNQRPLALPPAPLLAGKHWCWVHWDLQLPVFDFFRSKELHLRAWDESMNTQAGHMSLAHPHAHAVLLPASV